MLYKMKEAVVLRFMFSLMLPDNAVHLLSICINHRFSVLSTLWFYMSMFPDKNPILDMVARYYYGWKMLFYFIWKIIIKTEVLFSMPLVY